MDTEKKTFGDRLKASSLVQAWLVLLLAVSFGVSLAGVQMALGPIIETNKLNETLEKVPELVLGGDLAAKMSTEGETLDILPRQMTVERPDRAKVYNVYEARYQDELRGWVVKTRGQGYADAIELLFGIAPDRATITGLFVLDQKETPGLGNKILADDWRGQFIGAPTAQRLTVVKTGAKAPGEIDVITGATISSKAVTTMINAAMNDLRQPLADADKKGENNG